MNKKKPVLRDPSTFTCTCGIDRENHFLHEADKEKKQQCRELHTRGYDAKTISTKIHGPGPGNLHLPKYDESGELTTNGRQIVRHEAYIERIQAWIDEAE